MRVLALDPGASTGYCLTDTNSGEIYAYGFLDVDDSNKCIGYRCTQLQHAIDLICKAHLVEHVVVEDYFFSSRFASGVSVNAAYRTAIYMHCYQSHIPYTIINPSEWKKFIAGSARPDKKQKKKWGKEAAKKMMIVEALAKRWNILLPSYSISIKTGKPIKYRCDTSDAIGQMIFYLSSKLQIKSITCTVPLLPPNPKFPSEF